MICVANTGNTNCYCCKLLFWYTRLHRYREHGALVYTRGLLRINCWCRSPEEWVWTGAWHNQNFKSYYSISLLNSWGLWRYAILKFSAGSGCSLNLPKIVAGVCCSSGRAHELKRLSPCPTWRMGSLLSLWDLLHCKVQLQSLREELKTWHGCLWTNPSWVHGQFLHGFL